MPKVVGIGASPRRGSFNDKLLDKALEAVRETGLSTEKIILNEIDFKACQDCGGCSKTGVCILEDGLKDIYGKVTAADALIVASPIFFGSVTAQLKMFIDRLQCVWIAGGAPKKIAGVREGGPAAFILTAGQNRPAHFENAASIIRILFLILGLRPQGELSLGDYDKRGGDTAWKKDALDRAFRLGREVAGSLARERTDEKR